MKHNLNQDGRPSLDQFFGAARNEPPLMGDDAFASIVEKADAVPSEVMKQSGSSVIRPTIRMMSAIRQQQGGMIMTGLGLTALTGLLITGYYLSPADPEQATKFAAAIGSPAATSIQASAASSHAAIQDPASQVIHQAPQHSSSSNELAVTTDPKPTPFRPAVSIDSLWSRVKVESIKPIEVTAEEVDKLGINDGDEGKVYLVHELSKGGVKMRMAFPPEGLSIKVSEPADGIDDVSQINSSDAIALLMPTMVTDAKGKKLAFFFKANAKSNGVDVQSMSLSQRDGDATDAPMPFPSDAQISISQNSIDINQMFINEDGGIEIGNEVEVDEDIDIKQEHELRIDGDKQLVRIPSLPPGVNFRMLGRPGVDMDSMFKAKGFNGAKMMMFTDDSNFKGKVDFDFDFKLDFDSLGIDINALTEQAKGMHQHALKIRINADSLRTEALRIMKDLNLDSMQKDMKLIRKQIRNLRADSIRGFRKQFNRLKELPQFNIQNLPRMKNYDLPMLRVDIEKINNLVPVKIKDIDPNVKHNQNGLIFWYARDEKFAEKAPATLRERIASEQSTDQSKPLAVSSVSAISEPMVYPNPTPGRAIFKYSLSAPRAVSIAVHDLLGKQVMKVTNLETKAAGTFEKELDLSSLEAGVYLLIMVTDVGEQTTQRVVIER